MKVFQAMHDAEDRSAAMYISNVGEMDDMIAEGNATQLILAHEALMEKRVGDIAEEIARRKDVRFVMIAGPSSSGKTTFSHRLSTQLMACGRSHIPSPQTTTSATGRTRHGMPTASTILRDWVPWTWSSSTAI